MTFTRVFACLLLPLLLTACSTTLGGGRRSGGDSGVVGIDATTSDSGMFDGAATDAAAMDAVVATDAPVSTTDAPISTTDAPTPLDSSVISDAGTSDAPTPLDSAVISDAGTSDAGFVYPDSSIPLPLPTIIGTASTRESVLAVASAQSSPAQITIYWAPVSGRTVSGIQVFRKMPGATSWGGAIGTPAASADRYVDSTVGVGGSYEYKIQMATSSGTAYGYVSAGLEAPAVHYRGKLILIVHHVIESAIATELSGLRADLEGEGWNVISHSTTSSSTPQSIRALIQADYASDSTNVKAVLLLGHIPVAYAGSMAPDGHHSRPWPADGYYGDVDGTWPDGGSTDAYFTPTNFPSSIELQVGRVDFRNMDAFSASIIADDPVLYNQYLQRLHRYKSLQTVPVRRALIIDNFDSDPYRTQDYRFAGGGWRNFVQLIGPWTVSQETLTIYDTGSYVPYYQQVDGQSYLWTYAAGGGGYTQASGIGTTWEFASVETGGVFNIAFGSYFGEWDNNNNFLRAFMTGGAGLTSVWGGTTHWYFHSMGLGETIGYGTRATMNNKITSTYAPANGACCGTENAFLTLMGDPTLRMNMPAPASNLSVSNVGGKASFTWTASPDATFGYHLYEITSGAITRITSTPVAGTSFTSALDYASGHRYSVRAHRLQATMSGTYFDLSLGVFDTAP